MAPRGRGVWTMKYMVHIPRPRGAIIICQVLNTFVQIRIDSIMKIFLKFLGGGSFVHDQRTYSLNLSEQKAICLRILNTADIAFVLHMIIHIRSSFFNSSINCLTIYSGSFSVHVNYVNFSLARDLNKYRKLRYQSFAISNASFKPNFEPIIVFTCINTHPVLRSILIIHM